MTLSRIRTTGRGRLSARLVIEGWEYEYVSAKRMEGPGSDGRTRVVGLDLSDVVIGASADLTRSTLKGQSLTVRIKDLDRIAGKRHGRVTRSLLRSPTVSCYLGADLAYNGTSITIRGGGGAALPSAGVVHIGTEAIVYATKVGSVLGALTRGAWQTIAQSHFVADGEGLADALITDQPLGVEGRRAYLYLYGDGDSPTGDGTLRWRGVCATDVRWSGGACEIEVDPITRLWDQPLGGDLSGPVSVRGIHYTTASPWALGIANSDTDERCIARVVGFFETQDEFCAAATTEIAAAIADAGLTIGDGAIELTPEVGGYRVTYRSDSTTAHRIFCDVASDIDYLADGTTPTLGSRPGWDPRGDAAPIPHGSPDWVPATSATESFRIVAPVPRATLGRRLGWRRDGSAVDTPDADFYTLYLGGTVVPATGDALVIGGGDDDAWPATVYDADAAARTIQVIEGIPSSFVRLDPGTEITLGRRLATGSFLDVLDALALSSRALANTGAMPLFVGDDVTWETDIDDHVASLRLATGRGFYLFEGGATLAEMLTPEMLACGVYPRLTATGRIELKRLAPPLPGATADWTIDDSAAFGSTIEKSPRGVLSQVLYRVGYDPRSDEWDERTITFRDVQSTSATRTPITLEIAQKSTDTGSWRGSETGLVGVPREEVLRIAIAYLGLFGMPTAVCSIEADARYMNALIGDTVSLSSSILPDVSDGVSAMSERSGLIVATSLELATGRVSLGVLVHTQRFTGYAPAFPVAAQSNVSGNTWDIDVTLSPYTSAATVGTWLAIGDEVRVTRPDSAAADETGDVISIIDANTVRVTFDTPWTPGTDDWILHPSKSPNHAQTDPLARFCFVAATDYLIEYDGADVDAQVLA